MLENARDLTNTTVHALEGFLGFLSDYWQELSALAAIITIVTVVIGLVFKWVFQKQQHEHEKEMERMRQEYDEKVREIERENYLRSLLLELKYNKNLADKSEKKRYDASAYKDVKEAKYFHVLPAELREKINEAQIMLLNAQLRDKPHLYHVELIDTERLKELYGDIVPKFEEYLRKTKK